MCPPFTDLRTLQTLIEADRIPIQLGAQNCHWEDQGAFTGEVSPPCSPSSTSQYVIVGHSERRQLFGETDDDGATGSAGRSCATTWRPIVCVGETLDEHDRGETDTRVVDQITAAFAG